MTSDEICAAFAAKDQEIARLRNGLLAARADMTTTRDSSITTPGEPLADRLHTSLEAISLVLGVAVPDRPEAPAPVEPDEGDEQGQQGDDEGEQAPAPAPTPAPAPIEPPAPAPTPEPEPGEDEDQNPQPLV